MFDQIADLAHAKYSIQFDMKVSHASEPQGTCNKRQYIQVEFVAKQAR